MTVVTLPFDFVGGTRAIADQVDANFNALANALNAGGRTALISDTTFYVAPGGADIAGNGLSPTTPSATIGFIVNLLQESYDLGTTKAATIQLANGAYNESVLIESPLSGQGGANQLNIQGNLASPNLVTISGDPCFNLLNGGLARFSGMTMTSSVSSCIISQQGSRAVILNCIFSTAVMAHLLAARGGSIRTAGNYTISGGAQAHVMALEAGEIFLDEVPTNLMAGPVGQPVVTLTGTPAFSQGFATALNLSCMHILAAFSGAATGPRWFTNRNSSINIQGQGATYLPGDTAGSDNSGGQTG